MSNKSSRETTPTASTQDTKGKQVIRGGHPHKVPTSEIPPLRAVPTHETLGLNIENSMPEHRHSKASGNQNKGTGGGSSARPSSGSSSKSGSTKLQKDDDWRDVTDSDERRRIQNRLAQRVFREKKKEEKERIEVEERNRRAASYAYSTPNPREMANDANLSGLPWGSLSLKHIVERGNERQREYGSQDQSYEHGTGRGSGHGSESR